MRGDYDFDVVVVGSGPNGLAAGISLLRHGCTVLLLEARDTVGGGMRSSEVTLPGFVHDTCSAIHPLAVTSPFFKGLNLTSHGLEWIYPTVALAHPFEDGTAALLYRSIDDTGKTLGVDGPRYVRLMKTVVTIWERAMADTLGPLRVPRHPVATTRFGIRALLPATWFATRWFSRTPAQGLFAGMAAHSIAPLEHWTTAAFGLTMAAAGHVVGWPMARGGSQKLADALAHCFTSQGGILETDVAVRSSKDVPKAKAVFYDVSPTNLAGIVGNSFPSAYRKQLEQFRHGPGVWKIDWALDGPIPWKAAECLQAGTVHVGGTLKEIAAAERAVWNGRHSEKPFVILAQQSLFDQSRAPAGKQTAWGYCHVPNGSNVDMTERIEARIEGFAPGFRDRIIGRHIMSPLAMEEYNGNYSGGDIAGGMYNYWSRLVRPMGRWKPYATPLTGVYLCSASMPPGGGVHGMCGYYAAKRAIKECF